MLRAAVIGSGPNGLAGAIELSANGYDVDVFERSDSFGGGARTRDAGMRGVIFDECSGVHPMALASRFFRHIRLTDDVEFLTPKISFGHALSKSESVLVYTDVDDTANDLGGAEGAAWRRLFGPLMREPSAIDTMASGSVLGNIMNLPAATRAGVPIALLSGAWNRVVLGDRGRAAMAGVGAHAIAPVPSPQAAAVGTVLATYAQTSGWPIPRGGSQAITDAMLRRLVALGGRPHANHEISDLAEVSGYDVVLADVSPRDLALLDRRSLLPASYRSKLTRFRYGPGVAKLDLVLGGEIPWADDRLKQAGTVHLGGSQNDIAFAETEIRRGRIPEHPYVLVSQPSLLDGGRAPQGLHVIYAYAHVPSGYDVDPTEMILAEIERFAPGTRDLVLHNEFRSAAQLERHNQNYVGGDINAGAMELRQFLARPIASAKPWRTPMPGLYLCSSSTAPGPGVHGLCGWNAARTAIADQRTVRGPA